MYESYQTEKLQLLSMKKTDPFSYEVVLFIKKGSYSKQHITVNYTTKKQPKNSYWKLNLKNHVSKFYHSLFRDELYQLLNQIEEEIILKKEYSTPFPVISDFKLVNHSFNTKDWNLVVFRVEGSKRLFRTSITLHQNRWIMDSLEIYVKESNDWRNVVSLPSLLFYDGILDQLSNLISNFPSLRIRLLGTYPSKRFSGELYEEIKQKKG